MTVYKLFASGATTADGVATLDIQNKGDITSIWGVATSEALDALGEGVDFEVSFSSVSGFSTNDTRASFFGLGYRQNFLTSGGGVQGQSAGITGLRVPVDNGERMYLHRIVSGAPGTTRCAIWLFVDDGTMELPARRRRQG
jgi:hypothetical protein